MFKKSLILFAVPFFLCMELNAQSNNVDSSAMVTLRIDPENVRGAQVSDIFDEVKFIPLETTKQSVFGSIAHLIVADHHFVILDSDTRSIFIFDKKGKYHTKIEKSKIEKDKEGRNFRDEYFIRIITDNGQKVISVYNDNSDLYYDVNGNLLKKRTVAQVESDKMKSIKGTGYHYQRHWKDQDSTLYDLAFFKNGQVFSKYLPPKKIKGYPEIIVDRVTSQEDMTKNYFLTKIYTNNIYKASPPKLALAYRVIFPAKMSLPSDFIDNPIYEDRAAFLNKNKGRVYALSNVHLYGDHLFFKIGVLTDGDKGNTSMIYNVKNAEVISFDKIEPDEKSFYLPITDMDDTYSSLFGFAGADGTYLYNSYSSLSMFEFKEENDNEKVKYDEVLTTYFKTENRKSNPLIIQLKPKQ